MHRNLFNAVCYWKDKPNGEKEEGKLFTKYVSYKTKTRIFCECGLLNATRHAVFTIQQERMCPSADCARETLPYQIGHGACRMRAKAFFFQNEKPWNHTAQLDFRIKKRM